MYKKLHLIANWLGIVPVNIFNTNFFLKYLNILLNLIYLLLFINGLFNRVIADFENKLHTTTLIVADSIEGFNELLSLSSIFIMTRLHHNEWSVFLNYLQKHSEDKNNRNGRIDIFISIFAIIGTIVVNCYQLVIISSRKGFFNVPYYSYYVCNIYHIFLAAFLSLIGHILIGHQQNILNRLKRTKTYFVNEKLNGMKKIKNKFTNVCVNIKNLNLLYGWQMLFIFSGGVVNVIFYINFVVYRNSLYDNVMMTVTDSFRMAFYMVS